MVPAVDWMFVSKQNSYVNIQTPNMRVFGRWLGHEDGDLMNEIEVKWSESHSVVSDSLWSHGLYSPWNSPGKNTGVGSLSLLQGLFPTQGSNPGLPHCMWILYQLSHRRSPRILEWVAYSFSSRSSQHRNWTGVSCIAGRYFTNWAIRESSQYRWPEVKTQVVCRVAFFCRLWERRHPMLLS